MSWFTESNRYKHFTLGIPTGFLTIPFTLGIATGMEFKDVHHCNGDKPIKEWKWDSWDWIDWSCTVVGGIIGNAMLIGIILIIISICQK